MSNILIQGKLNLRVINKDGTGQFFELANQITSGMREVIFNALSLGEIASNPITRIGIGSGSTPASNSDSALETPILEKNILDISRSDNQLTFLFEEVGYEEANGETIREYGLLTYDNTLVARKLDVPVEKTNLKKLELSWVITFL
jgi:hypothetical protein